MCGFPCDNNAIESGNRGDKDFFDRRRVPAVHFVQKLSSRTSYVSRSDLQYYGSMKKNIHSKDFYQHVEHILIAEEEEQPCFLNINFPFTKETYGVPKGSFLIPTEHCIAAVDRTCLQYNLKDRPKSPTDYYKWIKEAMWIDQYKAVFNMHRTKLYVENMDEFKCRFDFVLDNLNSFHIIRPITLEDDNQGDAVQNLLDHLRNHDLKPIDYRALRKRGVNDGLIKCDCSNYLHYGWCKHACSFAFHRGILRKYPPYMDPTGLISKRKPGPPRKALPGHALSKK